MESEKFYYDYAKSLMEQPIPIVEADLNMIRSVFGDADVERVVRHFSAVMRNEYGEVA